MLRINNFKSKMILIYKRCCLLDIKFHGNNTNIIKKSCTRVAKNTKGALKLISRKNKLTTPWLDVVQVWTTRIFNMCLPENFLNQFTTNTTLTCFLYKVNISNVFISHVYQQKIICWTWILCTIHQYFWVSWYKSNGLLL